MADLFDITGLDVIQQHMQEISARMLPLSAIALQQEADAILEASQPLVPVDTGALRASGAVDDPQLTATTATTGVRYGGDGPGFERRPREYCLIVHEDTTKHHPIGQDHFLTLPFYAATAGMLSRLADALRLGL